MAFLKPSDLVWSTSPPSVRGIWASTCSGGDGRRERMSARDRGRGARVGVARGSAGKETHVQEVEDGSHGVGWGAAMSPERSHGVKRRDGGSALLFLRAACLARVLPLLARLARISKRTPPNSPISENLRKNLKIQTGSPGRNPMVPDVQITPLGIRSTIVPLRDSRALVSQRTKVSSCLATSTPMPAWTLSSARASLAALPRPSWRCVREPPSPVMRHRCEKNSIRQRQITTLERAIWTNRGSVFELKPAR